MTTNSSSPAELYCPLLEAMLQNRFSNHTGVNLTVVLVHGLVSCLGILENGLVLWVLGFQLRRQRTVSSVWVLNLAASDFLATLTLPLFTHYFSRSQSWELGGLLCSTQASVFFLNMFVSAFLLAAISLDRCLLVARPAWSQNRRSVSGAWKVCVVGWVWGAVNAFPYFLFRAVTEKQDRKKLCYHHFALYSSSATLVRDCKVRQVTTAVSKALLAFLLPLVVIAGSYGSFILGLRKRRIWREGNTVRLNGVNNEGGGGARAGAKGERGGGEREGGGFSNSRTFPPLTNMNKSQNPNLLPPLPPLTAKHGGRAPGLSRSFTKMVTSVIAAFVLCWAPYHVFCLIEVAVQHRPQLALDVAEVGLPIATTFTFLNPVLNPVLYAFNCPHFCVRIRQSLSALMEGLVEEGGRRRWVEEGGRRREEGEGQEGEEQQREGE